MAIDFNEKIFILDGGMGTMLQQAGMKPGETTTRFGISNPHIWKDIYRQYIEAGADIIYAGTFGINRFKEDEADMPVTEAVKAVMKIAVEARDEAVKSTAREVRVALDIGPLGQLLEPMGTLTFEEAYDAFAEIVRIAKDCGADLAVVETMTDLYEVKAAVLAIKENSELPVMVSMTFEENGRTFTGTSIEAMAITLEGLGVDAMGINCSLGPVEILPLIQKLRRLTDVPVLAKPNAGLPNPATGEYDITCEDFIQVMKQYMDSGVNLVGGCCGTTPEYIKGLADYRDMLSAEQRDLYGDIGQKTAAKARKRQLMVCGSTDVICADHVTVIGERINPTGKKRLKQALLDKDFDYILNQAVQQIDAGAEILDVNVGVPSLDDVAMLPALVRMLQSITGLPLQIDSSNPKAIEAALRVYNGKAIVNSVNGEEQVMDSILPVVKKYGAAVIGLTLDQRGIPATAEERFDIAEKILNKALEYGIPREDVIIDCLTLTASAQQKEVNETLRAVRMVKERLGLRTTLGVSNISFGLPARVLVNRTFLAMALECGLDLPIINPNEEDMMSAVFAFNVLKNTDKNAEEYIKRYGNMKALPSILAPGSSKASADSSSKAHGKTEKDVEGELLPGIFHCIEKGMKAEAVKEVEGLLEEHDEMEIVSSFLIPALDRVGKGFENGRIFLPQMLQAATAAQAGFDVIKTRLAEAERAAVSLGEVVIATVKGDIHDIGKNIVKVIMENYGYKIIDLGRDVAAEKIVEAVLEKNIRLVGLSALMTTTLKSMEETIEAVKKAAPGCKVMVGGAVLTEDYAKKIGADYYCRDAMKSVEAAQEVFG